MANRIGGRGTLPGIQLLRALAALMVVACHTSATFVKTPGLNPLLDTLAIAGAAGVDMFFVISGFVIVYGSISAQGERPAAPAFLVRRFTRIFPLYWCVLLLTIGIRAVGFLRNADMTPHNILRGIFLLPSEAPVVMVAWTLTYELLFYLIFAITLRWRGAAASAALVTGVLGGLLLIAPYAPDPVLQDFLGYEVMLEFCMGAWLAVAFLRYPGLRCPPLWTIVPLLGSVMLAAWLCPHDAGEAPAARAYVWGAPMTLIVWSSLGLGRSAVPRLRLGLLLGDASYAIYLVHALVLLPLAFAIRHELVPDWSWPALALLSFGASIAAGVTIHRIVERPMLRMLRRWQNRSGRVTEAALA